MSRVSWALGMVVTVTAFAFAGSFPGGCVSTAMVWNTECQSVDCELWVVSAFHLFIPCAGSVSYPSFRQLIAPRTSTTHNTQSRS